MSFGKQMRLRREELHLSRAALAEELGVSRQAIHDLLKRVEQLLERYEASLQVLAKEEALHEELHKAIALLATDDDAKKVEAVSLLQGLCGEGR